MDLGNLLSPFISLDTCVYKCTRLQCHIKHYLCFVNLWDVTPLVNLFNTISVYYLIVRY